MNELWEVVRESLPEIIGGLVVAATLALIGTALRKFGRKDEPPSVHHPSSLPVQGEPVVTPEEPQLHLPVVSVSPLVESPVFKQLLYFARRGQCRLFIGSGVSSEAGMPDETALRDVLRAELRELGESVRSDARLSELATALEKEVGRSQLLSILRRPFDDVLRERPWEQGAYPWIPRLPRNLVQVVYTTNWDDLLKRAFEESGQTVREIRHPDEISLIPQAQHAIVKVHRDFQSPDGPIVSEADYAVALRDIEQGTAGTLWGHLADQLAQYRFVFVGYSLGDSTLNLIRRVVELHTGTIGEKRHFLVAPLSREEARAAERWAGMFSITAYSSAFFQTLAEALDKA